jgi:hypothetical protein
MRSKLIWMELARPDSLVDSYHRLITPLRKPVRYTIKLADFGVAGDPFLGGAPLHLVFAAGSSGLAALCC